MPDRAFLYFAFLIGLVVIATQVFAAGRGTCGGGNCGGYTSPTETDGFIVDTDASLIFKSATAATERLRITATGSLSLTNTAPKTSADFSAKSDGLILQTAAAASGASCVYAGAIRYNSTLGYVEYCNGTKWTAFITSSTAPPVATATSGYFVMTQTAWDGNLGGINGANAKCLAELTTYTSWMGYSDANSRGLLTSTHVYTWAGTMSADQGMLPQTTYYFARVGDSSVGGAYFTTDSNGSGPGDYNSWAGKNYFGSSRFYWGGKHSTDSTHWGTSYGGCCGADDCAGFTSNSSSSHHVHGDPTYTNERRIDPVYYPATCDVPMPMLCFVNP